MKKHLVILGRKANSWAFGVEQAGRLLRDGAKPLILSFEENRSNHSIRMKYLFEVLNLTEADVFCSNQLVTKTDIKNNIKIGKLWLKDLSKNSDWVNSELFGLPMGRILMSNFARIAGTRNFKLDLIPLSYQLEVVSLALLANSAYDKLKFEFDEITIPNGRSPIESVMLFRSREQEKEIHVTERGSDKSKIAFYKTSPHFAPDWWNDLERFTLRELNENSKIIENYWSLRLQGIDELSGKNWSKSQAKKTSGKFQKDNTIAFFCTSEHEVPVIAEFETSNIGYSSQQAAVRDIVKACKTLNLHLIIKRHPNSLAANGIDRESTDWDWVKSNSDITYLDARDETDSYALLKEVRANLVFKSSIGVEATAMKLPSRALGPAKWAYSTESRIDNYDNLVEFLRNPSRLPSEISDRWGLMLSTFGEKLIYFKEIHGGYAMLEGGSKIFSADTYSSLLNKVIRKFRGKFLMLALGLKKK